MIDEQGRWQPDLYPRQREALAACLPSPENLILLNGPRMSSNTVGCLHAVCQHAWTTDRANICMLTITQSVGVDSGPWQHLTEIFMPQWIEGDFGMEWVREPYVQSVTKKPTCSVTNMFGTKSVISLESLKNEDEVEARFKGKMYSMIWINELSKFRQRKTFDTLKQCFRMPHLTLDQHLLLCDTNPDLDLGVESWIYRLWYTFKGARSDEEIRTIFPDIDPKILRPLQKRLKLIEFTVDDNFSMSEERKAELMADFAHDPDLLKAYYYGQWVTASTDAIFHKVFRPLFHVIPSHEQPVDEEPEILVPEENCIELITGWDPGITNSAAVIAEKTFQQSEDGRQLPVIKYLDEVVITNDVHSLDDFVLAFMKKMEFWERVLGRPGKTIWRHWSDRSVLDMHSPESNRYFHQIIYDASVMAIESGEVQVSAPILLEAAWRGPGSVGQRVDLMKKLLYDERVFFGRYRCPKLIEAMKGLKKAKTGVGVIAKGSIHKHPVDAATYLAASECYDELSRAVMLNLRKKSETESTIVSIPH